MYHIIINPASRSGKALKLWKQIIEPQLHKEGVTYRSYFSERPGDVARLTNQITANISSSDTDDSLLRLIILGGDGTINEAIQGLVNPSRVILGYIPTGSSNDLARDLKIPKAPLETLHRILHNGSVHSMDMGILTYADGYTKRFAVSSGIGYDAAVCEEILHSRIKAFFNKIGLGKLTYLGIALKQLFFTKTASCDIILDDKDHIHMNHFLFIASMNHRYEGGGFQFCPDADHCDGILDICAVGNLPKLLILFALPTAFFGKHYIFPGINAYRARKIQITASRPMWIHTDGEVHKKTDNITITCIKDALNIIY